MNIHWARLLNTAKRPHQCPPQMYGQKRSGHWHGKIEYSDGGQQDVAPAGSMTEHGYFLLGRFYHE